MAGTGEVRVQVDTSGLDEAAARLDRALETFVLGSLDGFLDAAAASLEGALGCVTNPGAPDAEQIDQARAKIRGMLETVRDVRAIAVEIRVARGADQ